MCLIKEIASHMFSFVKDPSYFAVWSVGRVCNTAINTYYDGVSPSPQIKPMIWLKMGTAIQMGKTNDSFKDLKLAVYFQAYFFCKKVNEQISNHFLMSEGKVS